MEEAGGGGRLVEEEGEEVIRWSIDYLSLIVEVSYGTALPIVLGARCTASLTNDDRAA